MQNFQEVFPTLKLNSENQGLLPLITVNRMVHKSDRHMILIQATFHRLADRKLVREIEKALDQQIFAGNGVHAVIDESYDLPSVYTLQDILEAYTDSIAEDFSEKSHLNAHYFRSGTFRAEGDQKLIFETEEGVYSQGHKKEWSDSLRQLFLEKFAMEITVEVLLHPAAKKEYLNKGSDTVVMDRPDKKRGEEFLDYSLEANRAKAGDAPNDSQKAASGSLKTPGDAKKAGGPAQMSGTKEDGKVPGSSVSAGASGPRENGSYGPANRDQGGLRKGAKGREGGVKTSRRMKSDDPSVIFGWPFPEETQPIASYPGNKDTEMIIQGQVLTIEKRELRDGIRSIVSFAITDETDSISVKVFVPNEEADELMKQLSVGTVIKLKGMASLDTFDKELTIRSVQGILHAEKTWGHKRVDNAPRKRVELHCHTKASINDGLAEVSDLLKTAKGWGHKAMAVTDHGNVYAFPEAFHTIQKMDDFKVIYGMEGYLVDDTRATVTNPMDLTLQDTCVVFDIETTGFSPVQNKIIEIGAVKLVKGEITDRFSTFINPGVPIPYRIEQLTGITDEMVQDADPVEKVLPRFMDFIQGAYLVAHNAGFDTSFIIENCKRLGIAHDPFTIVDTLGIARAILLHLKNHRLETLAKELGVPLVSHHRAVDDAECTAGIYQKLIRRLESRNLYTLKEVEDATHPSQDVIRMLPSYHIILLAQNDTGRVNLYRLISDSGLKYYGGHPVPRPRIPRSLLMERREGLILGSACAAGELFNAILEGAPEDELEKIVNFYDYLEIQPIMNNAFLFNKKDYDISSKEDLQELNRRIVRLGEKYHKPVCATCDVHFLNPEDWIYRAILQAGSGYKESEEQPPLYFRTTDEMLEEFGYLGAEKAYEVVVENTNLIADRIEKIAPVRPDKCPPVIENADVDLRNACFNKAHELYGDPLPKIVEDRLNKELTSIIGNGYAVMYMIAQKLVSKSVTDGYLVGSRGSVGSSFAATMSGITEVNPLKPHYRCPNCKYSDFDSDEVNAYIKGAGCDMPDKKCPKCGTLMVKDGFNIPFETFLGFKGDKEPDIDLNFSGEYQSKAHAYTEVIFGKGQTFRAGTVGTVAEKTAIGYTLHYFEDQNIEKRRCEVARIAHHVEGVIRTSGQHPGGIVVLPFGEDINTFTPIQHPANDQTTSIVTTHFEYHSIDHNLLKLDILGHDDPTMIRMLQDLTQKDPTKFPLDSPEVMQLFKDTSSLGVTPEEIRGCKLGALGVPEFGTDFAMNMVLECKPEHLSDLIRIAGMAHGTDVWAGNNQVLIESGKATISTAICCRDDIMEYLISMGMDPAKSFTIMEAVRKGKGLKPEWEEDMVAHKVPDWYIWSCKKIKYMFPKAHAAAYVMMAWRIAYCKVFYPLEYYCAYYSIRADGFDYEKMCQGKKHLENEMDAYLAAPKHSDKEDVCYRDMRIVQEMYARGFDFVPIDIMRAQSTRFTIVDARHLMPSLTSIDGMGEVAADTVVEAAKKGPFTSLSDFRNRTKVSQTLIDKMLELKILEGLPPEDQLSFF